MTSKYIWIFLEKCPKIKRLIYLQLGADGTFYDEMHADELVLIIAKIIKRNKTRGLPETLQKSNKFELDFELVPHNSSIKLANANEIELTKMEYKILEYLYLNKGVTVTHKELIEALWSDKNLNKIYRVANLIFHLRNKIENDVLLKTCITIKTVRSKGYRLQIK